MTRLPERRPVTKHPLGHTLIIDFAHVAKVLRVKAEMDNACDPKTGVEGLYRWPREDAA